MAGAAAALGNVTSPATSKAQIGPGPALVGLALTVGFVLRLAPMMLTDFPLLDGGLFATLARDIREAGFILPDFSTYNGGGVPFAYPPLGLYVLAAIPGDPIVTERWLPMIWSLASIALAYLLARELTDDERHAGIAALVFAAMPATWAIEGGGVARALGLALLLAALWRMAVTLRAPTLVNGLVAGSLAGLAMLAHPGVAPTGVVSTLILLAYRPSPRGMVATGTAVAMSIAVMAPWVATVVQRYGIGAFQAASQAHNTEESLGRLLITGPSWAAALDLVFPLAILGLIVAIHRREWLLPAWIVAAILVPGGEGRYATVMWAMLASVGVLTVGQALEQIGALKLAMRIGLAWLFVTALLAGYNRFDAIPGSVREAMAAAGRDTPPGTSFAVVVRDPSMAQPILDWFPELSGRRSVGTFMGLEWTSVERWDATVALNRSIQQGEVPPNIDAVFVVDGSSASWELVR